MTEKTRRLGPYRVVEHTARRLILETRGGSLIAVGVLWAIYGALIPLIAPWRGTSRLFVAATTAGLLIVVSLLLLRFLPARRRVVVDCEAGEYRVEQQYWLARRIDSVRVPLEAAVAVRRRRRVWEDAPTAQKVEWVVEVVGDDGKALTVARDEDEAAMAEMARLLAEVGTCPLEEPDEAK